MADDAWAVDLGEAGRDLLTLLEDLRDGRTTSSEFGPRYETLVHQAGAHLADGIGLRASALSHDAHRQVAPFNARLAVRWGPALDRYVATTAYAEQVGAEFSAEHEGEATRGQDYVFIATRLLHARACRIAREIHCLLANGFPDGAMARWRTLHEVAVVACLLGFEGDRSIAERYLDHAAVKEYKHAQWLQERFREEHPVSEEEYGELLTERDRVAAKYPEQHYDSDYGWAIPLVNKARPNFDDLEARADLSKWRPAYRIANRSIHADSLSAHETVAQRGQDRFLVSGPVNIGLSEPAGNALVSLTIATSAFLLGTEARPEPGDAINAAALGGLTERAITIFRQIEQAIAAEEAALSDQSAP